MDYRVARVGVGRIVKKLVWLREGGSFFCKLNLFKRNVYFLIIILDYNIFE